jgi:hypothetical protein
MFPVNAGLFRSKLGAHCALRQIYIHIACKRKYALSRIGRQIFKDHATVIHYRDAVQGRLMTDKNIIHKDMTFKQLLFVCEREVNIIEMKATDQNNLT